MTMRRIRHARSRRRPRCRRRVLEPARSGHLFPAGLRQQVRNHRMPNCRPLLGLPGRRAGNSSTQNGTSFANSPATSGCFMSIRDALRFWTVPVVLGGALLWAYAATLGEVVARWVDDPQYSHGFLVPVFAIFLLW